MPPTLTVPGSLLSRGGAHAFHKQESRRVGGRGAASPSVNCSPARAGAAPARPRLMQRGWGMGQRCRGGAGTARRVSMTALRPGARNPPPPACPQPPGPAAPPPARSPQDARGDVGRRGRFQGLAPATGFGIRGEALRTSQE